MLEEASWRSWPPKGGSSATPEPREEGGTESPSISTDTLVDRAVSCAQEWGGLDEKTAALATADSTVAITNENIWRHTDAHPFVLYMLLIDRYGEEAASWLPETIRMTLEKDGTALSRSAYTKLLASSVLLASPSPWRQWEVFHWVSRGLAGLQPNIAYLEEPEVGHMFVMADLMHLTDPKRPFGTEVDKFVAAALAHDGIHYAPPPIDFAQHELDNPKIACKSCSTINRDDSDIRCISCGGTQLVRLPAEFAESRDAAKALWAARNKLPVGEAVDGLPDTGAGNAVYRLLVHWDYARRVRAHMVQQLRMVGGRR